MSNRKSLLIVDDSKSNIEILLELLSDKYDVIPALNGSKALEIIAKMEIDLILLDIIMPNLDGYSVCRELKSNPNTKDIPVIFITAKTDEESIETAYNVGGIDYITKPFKPKEVLLRVATQIALLEQIEIQKTMLMHQSKLAAMGEMMDSVAHQWKQPLSSIRVEVSLLDVKFTKGNLDQDYLDLFQTKISSQITHMVSTLDEFSSFFRPSKKITTFSVKSMISKVLLLVEDEFMSNKIAIKVNDINDFTLLGIENEFKHLVLNIINNAKDAFNENRITKKEIYINVLANEKSIEISDNAGGIAEELIEEIFKVNITTKDTAKGSGIGLYLSKQIAEKHNGSLSVANIKNGAKFTFTQNS